MDPMVAPDPEVAPPPPNVVGVVDSTGRVVMVPADQVGSLGPGFAVATPEQVAVHNEALRQAGAVGAIKAAVEGAADTVSFGTSSWAERELGLSTPEEMAARRQAHPISYGVGALGGALAPLGAEELLAGSGLEKLAGGAPGLIADLGEAGANATRSALGPTTKLGRIGAEVLAKGAGSAIEGAAYGLGQSVSEDALDPDLTVESALAKGGADALLGAAFGGTLGVPMGLVSSALKELPTGAALADRLEQFEGEQNIKAAGALSSDVSRVLKKTSREDLIRQANEARDLGIIGRFNSPDSVYEKAATVLDEAGQGMQDVVAAVDAKAATNPRLMPDLQQVADEFRASLEPLEKSYTQERALKTLTRIHELMEKDINSEADALSANFPAEVVENYRGRVSLQRLWEIRRDVSEAIYGYKGSKVPSANKVTEKLQELRAQLSRMMGAAVEKAGEDSAEWRQLNRNYQVASTMQDFADRALTREQGNNRFSLTELGAMGAGFLHGGPLGVAAPLGYIGARRYGSDLLGLGARALRERLEAGGLEAPSLTHAKSALEKAASIGEVPMAPIDTLRPNTPDQIAALAALERIQRDVVQDIHGAANDLVKTRRPDHGAPAAPPSAEILETAANVRRLANTPEELQRLVTGLTDETHEHAPNASLKTGEVSGRLVSYLAAESPQSVKPFPLGPELAPDRSTLLTWHEKLDALKRPLETLRENPSKVAVQAIGAVYPTLLAEARSALIAAMATAGHDHEYSRPQKQAINNILGVDLDGSESPSLTLASQMAYAALNSPRPPRAPHSSLKLKTYSERLSPTGSTSLRNP